MQSSENSASLPPAEPVGNPPNGEPPPEKSPDAPTPDGRTSRRPFLVLLAGGLLGAVTAWTLIQRFDGYFVPVRSSGVPEEVQRRYDAGEIDGGQVMGMVMAQVDMAERERELFAERRAADIKNAALGLALFGLAVCGFLGLAVGLVHGTLPNAALGLAAGMLLGGLTGTMAGLAAFFTAEAFKPVALLGEMRPILMHAAAFGLVGLAAGLTAGVAARRLSLVWTPLAATAAGAVAAAVYVPLATLLFPLERTDLVVPTGAVNRLFWVACAAGLLALLIGRLGRTAAPSPPGSTEPAAAPRASAAGTS